MNSQLVGKAGPRFSRWQRGIIFEQKRHGKWDKAKPEVKDPIRERQEELHAAVESGAEGLIAYLRRRLGLAPGTEIEAPPFPRPRLQPGEFREPPIELEEELGAAWKDHVRPRAASSPLFWLLCHIAWLEEDRFGRTGHDLAEAFTAGHGDRTREGRTRNFLRRTGGLPVARGNTSVFSDCPLARAWWRWYLSGQVERTTDNRVTARRAHEVLHSNRPAWEELAMLSLRRIVVVNQPRARAAIVSRLDRRLKQAGKINASDVKAVAGTFARQGLRRSFEHTSLEQLLA